LVGKGRGHGDGRAGDITFVRRPAPPAPPRGGADAGGAGGARRPERAPRLHAASEAARGPRGWNYNTQLYQSAIVAVRKALGDAAFAAAWAEGRALSFDAAVALALEQTAAR
jgi:hypothetical protein